MIKPDESPRVWAGLSGLLLTKEQGMRNIGKRNWGTLQWRTLALSKVHAEKPRWLFILVLGVALS